MLLALAELHESEQALGVSAQRPSAPSKPPVSSASGLTRLRTPGLT